MGFGENIVLSFPAGQKPASFMDDQQTTWAKSAG
jgi:hypothetical protein